MLKRVGAAGALTLGLTGSSAAERTERTVEIDGERKRVVEAEGQQFIINDDDLDVDEVTLSDECCPVCLPCDEDSCACCGCEPVLE